MNNFSIHSVPIFICLLFLCCNTDDEVFFKENFEKTIKNKLQTSGKGIISIDSLKGYKSQKSLFLNSGEGFNNRAFISIVDQIPKGLKSYHGSMQMFVEEASKDGIHWTIIETSGKTDKGFIAEVRYGGQHNKQFMANYDTHDIKTDCWDHTKFKIPENQWFLVEWYFSKEKSLMKLWINKMLVHDSQNQPFDKGCLYNDNNQEWTFPSVEKIALGWVDYQTGSGNRKVWIDDIVLKKLK